MAASARKIGARNRPEGSFWTPVRKAGAGTNSGGKWLVRCVCGAERVIRYDTYLSGTSKSCGCGGKPSREPPKDTRWTPLKFLRTDKYRNPWWLMRCSCGIEKELKYSSYMTHSRGGSKSCGCYREDVKGNPKLPAGEAAKRRVLYSYIQHARSRGFSFDLTREDFFELIGKDCHYCGSPPSKTAYANGMTGKRHRRATYDGCSYTYNGVDRMDSSLGYNSKNCVTCCSTCNFAKSDKSYLEFQEWINRLINFRNGVIHK